MTAILTILWFVSLVISVLAVFNFVGVSGLCYMFPEGERAWHLPAQLGSLALFATVVLLHPFK